MHAETDLPMEHVRRVAPPWRPQDRTECGLPVTGHPVITRDAFLTKVRRQGKQRAALTTCMTCWTTASRNQPWDENPAASLIREAERYSWLDRRYEVKAADDRKAAAAQFRNELLAIAALIEAHQDEFDALTGGLAAAPRLDQARRRRAAAQRRSQ
jgi:hypothetical protein